MDRLEFAQIFSVSQRKFTRAIYFNAVLIVAVYLYHTTGPIPLTRVLTCLILNVTVISLLKWWQISRVLTKILSLPGESGAKRFLSSCPQITPDRSDCSVVEDLSLWVKW